MCYINRSRWGREEKVTGKMTWLLVWSIASIVEFDIYWGCFTFWNKSFKFGKYPRTKPHFPYTPYIFGASILSGRTPFGKSWIHYMALQTKCANLWIMNGKTSTRQPITFTTLCQRDDAPWRRRRRQTNIKIKEIFGKLYLNRQTESGNHRNYCVLWIV